MSKVIKATAEIEFDFGDQQKASAVLRALEPELASSEHGRSKVYLTCRKTVLCLRVEANDTAALRAAVNSFIRLVKVAKDMVERCG